MVNICQTGLLILNFEIIPKKRIFRFLPKIFCRPCMKLKISFCQFSNPWTLRVSGMGGYTSKCEKSQNHCTLIQSLFSAFAYRESSHRRKSAACPKYDIVAEKIDELVMRKIPQIVRAESASFIVPVIRQSVLSLPTKYSSHLRLSQFYFSLSSTIYGLAMVWIMNPCIQF